jgi:tetratricopeptide (TPR) repeat protein
MHFVFINIGIPIILFVYAILILSVVKDFTIGISDFTETHHRSDTPQFFRIFPFLLIVSCLAVFTVILTIFLTSLEGKTYDFQQVLPPFIIAISCFIFSINIIYQEFTTGSNKLIGDTYYSKEKYKEACDRYKKIETHVNNKFYKTVFPSSDTFLSNLYMAYGDSKFRLGEREEALTLLNKSLEFAEKGNLTSYLWQIHYKIGQIKEEENKLEEAYESYKKSIEIIEDLRELVKIAERKEAFFENKAEVYAKMVFLCLRLGKDEEAFNYAERTKGRVFLELLGTEKVELKARHELKKKEEELLRKIREIEAKLRERREERYLWELS